MEQNGTKLFPLARNQFPPSRTGFVFKNRFPLIAVTVFASRRKLSSKVTVSIREKNPSPIARMKDTFKNTFPLDRKIAFPVRSL